MRLVIARMNHETNTFSPLATSLASFSPRWKDKALDAANGSQTAMGAFLEFAREIGAEVTTPVFATADPSGTVDDEAFDEMASTIVEAVRAGCDGVLLDLHGAMVTKSHADGEGELLARIRAVSPDVPIGVALDLHGNVTDNMLLHSDAIVGFKTYPHVDMHETGAHVARIFKGIISGDQNIFQSRRHPPILAQTLKMSTAVAGAMQRAIEAARAAETQRGVLAASIFGGFPLADIVETGMSVVVVAKTGEQADRVAGDLAKMLWNEREAFTYYEDDLDGSVARAASLADKEGEGPVLMLDHGDNCMSGGTCDTMDVVAEALRQGLRGILAGPICDPEAVEALISAGIGEKVSVEIGNRWTVPGEKKSKPPLMFSGIVGAVGSGRYTITGPTYTGMRCDMGRSVLVSNDTATILLTAKPHEPWDSGVFSSIGVDPASYRFLILKSRMYCRPVFEPLSRAVVECASAGFTSSKFEHFNFKRLTRPVFPLDNNAAFHASA